MTKFNESHIEDYTLKELARLGYTLLYGPDIAPDADGAERVSFNEVLLVNRLGNAIDKLNPTIPADTRQHALKEVMRIA